MQTNTYLLFNGTCEEAFKFYEKLLGGKIEAMLTHEGTPMENNTPAEWRKKIMHARMALGDQYLMASDAPPGYYQEPQGFSVNIAVDNVADAERIFKALAEGGNVRMALQETFWAKRFGMVTDRFGIPWMVNFENREPARNAA
ncbi:MAG TPA: VOC family protein [Pseudolabrys sp.]|nr:VOC family protein [Pseudolabrys sp.]